MSQSSRCVPLLLTTSLLCVLPLQRAAAEEEAAAKDHLHVGGALRLNYFVKSWEGQEGNRQRWGDVAFDTFRLNVDGRLSSLLLSAEYRVYAGYSMLHHGYIGYAFSESTQLQFGVHRVPFGLLPYASHNWFFALPYYLGFEDDYDLGLKLVHEHGPWNLQLAFYKNDEGSYTGKSTASARYSYDVVPVSPANPGEAYLETEQANSETNQLNARVAYRISHGELGGTELGASAQVGQLYNHITERQGLGWAAALHLNGDYGPWNVKLEALHYSYQPANPEGVDDSFVTVGAYDAPYRLASRGTVFVAGVSYSVPVSWGPISKLTFYDDYSFLLKSRAGYEDSHQNVLGALITAGPVFTYVDVASGKNQPWLGPDYGFALAEGLPDARWETRFNINAGYYF
ncbi:hypothetical protein [Archangium violaceum]|uniref:hypothetical protein n=1 Tax=Archangium violaceum TaxID=83451 RepID=UPI001EEFBB15|nr:hypothetical protein [Archangium violaceum]